MDQTERAVAHILDRMSAGESTAAADLLPMVYDELHRLAEGFFRHQRPGHTLQPTALVHEAFLRMARGRGRDWAGRGHFYAVAATAMRQILINHAEAKRTHKRGGDRERVTLDEGLTPIDENTLDVLDLDDALRRLERLDERQGKVVELRFFGGLSVEECADALEVSPRTVQLDWRMARLRLRRMLGDGGEAGGDDA